MVPLRRAPLLPGFYDRVHMINSLEQSSKSISSPLGTVQSQIATVNNQMAPTVQKVHDKQQRLLRINHTRKDLDCLIQSSQSLGSLITKLSSKRIKKASASVQNWPVNVHTSKSRTSNLNFRWRLKRI